jgi:hypothetical protein
VPARRRDDRQAAFARPRPGYHRILGLVNAGARLPLAGADDNAAQLRHHLSLCTLAI